MSRLPRLASVGLGLVLVLGAAAAWSPPARAAGLVTFGPATAKATFLTAIDVSEPVTLPVGVVRVEALVTTNATGATDVSLLTPTPAAGATTLRYQLPTPSGAMIPNTLVHVRFRITIQPPAGPATQELGPLATVRYSDTRFDWRTRSGDLVRVHWAVGDDAFGRRALAIGEAAVVKAAQFLGVTESNPIDFFIYPHPSSFRDVLGPGTRENVGGVAFVNIRTLVAQISPDQLNAPWVATVVPHELTHVVFDTATRNPYHSPPHWLNEGLAVYLSVGYGSGDRGEVAQAKRDDSLIPLPALDGQFPTAGDRFSLAYAESVSAIDFMARRYGRSALVDLIRSYAAGRTDDEAFDAALGVDLAGFDAAWFRNLGAPVPDPAGPRPAPSGPLPLGWDAPAQTPGTLPGASPTMAPTPTPAASATSSGRAPSETEARPSAAVWVALVAALLAALAILFVVRRRHRPPATSPS